MNDRLNAFCRDLLTDTFGGDLDSFDIQAKAIAYGLLIETEYDPEKHGPNDVDAEPGDSWLVFADFLK